MVRVRTAFTKVRWKSSAKLANEVPDGELLIEAQSDPPRFT